MRGQGTPPAPAWRPGFERMLRFGAVGATGAILNFVLLAILVDAAHMPKAAAAAIAIEVCTISNFILNRAWTWKDRDRSWWSLATYHGVTLGGTVTQFIVFVVATHGFGIHYLVASGLGIGAGTILNFLGNDRFTFKGAGASAEESGRRTARYMVAFAGMLGLALFWRHTWDTFVFEQTVREFVAQGTTPYETGLASPLYAYSGSGLPPHQMWFAYPPLAFLAIVAAGGPALLAHAPESVFQLSMRLPAILGVLVSAGLLHRFIRTAPGGTRDKADRAERFVLLNPLSWLVASVWGQLEPVMLACVMAAFLALRNKRWAGAGAALAAAVLIKPFAVYLVPVALVYTWRVGGKDAFQRLGAVAATFGAAVCLPFFFQSPKGFFELVVGMHGSRPPAHFAPINILAAAAREFAASRGIDPWMAFNAVGELSFVFTAACLTLLTFGAAKAPATPAQLVRWSAVSFAAGLLSTKVINEQYFLVPLVLWTAWAYYPHAQPPRRIQSFLQWTAGGVAFAAVFDRFHWITFLPDHLARTLLHRSAADAIPVIAAVFGLSVEHAIKATEVLAWSALLPLVFFGVPPLWKPLKEGWKALRRTGRRSNAPPRGGSIVAGLLVLLLMPVVGLAGHGEAASPVPPASAATPFIALVRTDFINPEHRPDVPSGDWRGLPVPADGYYTADAAKAVRDIDRLKAAGASGIVLVMDEAHMFNAVTWQMAAQMAGLPYAIGLDLREAEPGDAIGYADTFQAPAVPHWFSAWMEHQPAVAQPEWTNRTFLIHAEGSLGGQVRGAGLCTAGYVCLDGLAAGDVFAGSDSEAMARFILTARADGRLPLVSWNDFAGYGATEPVVGAPDPLPGLQATVDRILPTLGIPLVDDVVTGATTSPDAPAVAIDDPTTS